MENRDKIEAIIVITFLTLIISVIIFFSFRFGEYDLSLLLVLRILIPSLFFVYSLYSYTKGYKTSQLVEGLAKGIERVIQKTFSKSFSFKSSNEEKSNNVTLMLFATYMLLPIVLLILFFLIGIISFCNRNWFYIFSIALIILMLKVLNESISIINKVIVVLLLGGTIYAFSELRKDTFTNQIVDLQEFLFSNINEEDSEEYDEDY